MKFSKSAVLTVPLVLALFCLAASGVFFMNHKNIPDFLAHMPLKGAFGDDNSVAVSYMHDIGAEVKSSIISTTVQGRENTHLLARAPELIEAFEKNDPLLLQQLANRDFSNSLELDVVAFFNKEGHIVAMNTVDKLGKPISQERLDRVMNADFNGRGIISSCLINRNKKAVVEFQTHCDFTPALFDSSGLSVAFSVPVVHPGSDDRAGLISTRLNFQRILEGVNHKNLRFRGKDIFLVSDRGEYFSEEINSGKQAPPISQDVVMNLIRPLESNKTREQDIFLRQDEYYVNIFSLGIQDTMEKGNLYVLVRAPKSWVESESRRSRVLAAGFLTALGIALLFLVVMVFLGASRRRAVKLAHKMTGALRREMEERKLLESRVIQSEKMAAVGQLAGGVAHEINNPLGVILGFAQNVARRVQPGDPFEMPLRSIEREAMRCKNLVRDLLTFSASGNGKMDEIDLNAAIETALSLVSAHGKVKEVEIEKNLESDLPKILGNSTQIQQIIVNLSNNAIDAMPNGGKLAIRVQKTTLDHCKGIEIQVQDTGQGISPEIQSKIFNPFFTTKEIGKGTGLGLSLVYEIVKKHDGNISLDSELGKGTTFHVFLPQNVKERMVA